MDTTGTEGKRDAGRVIDAARDRAEELFTEVLGEPSSRGRGGLRFGAKGSFSAEVTGPKAGQWFDHSAGEGGGILDFWSVYVAGAGIKPRDAAFVRVLDSLAARLGIAGEESDTAREARAAATEARRLAALSDAEKEAEARRAVAQAVRDVCRPARGTAAAAYLESRGITSWPGLAVQFHDARALRPMEGLADATAAALVVFVTDAEGRVTGGQRVALDSHGRKSGKYTFGAVGAGFVRFPARPDAGADLYVAEGPETALSVWMATGCETWATLSVSNFARALPTDRRVILCPDRDPPEGTYPAGSTEARDKESAARTFAKATAAHFAAGVDLWIAEAPEPVGSKRDLNDTLQRAGVDAVRAALSAAKPYSPPALGIDPAALSGAQDDRIAALAAQIEARNTARRMIRGAVTGVFRREASAVSARRAYASWAAQNPPQEGEEGRARAKARRAVLRDLASRFGAVPPLRQRVALSSASESALAAWDAANPRPQPAPGDALGQAPREGHDRARRAFRAALVNRQGVILPTYEPPGPTPRRIALTGAQGIGKTHAVIAGLREARGLVTLVASPTLDKARETFDDYAAEAGADDPRPILFLGRSAAADDRAMCQIAPVAEAVARRGASVRATLCKGCPFAADCAYLAQEDSVIAAASSPQGAVIFATHAHLTIPLTSADLSPDAVVVDESPLSAMSETVTLSASDLFSDFPEPARLADTAAEADRQAAWGRVETLVKPLAGIIAEGLARGDLFHRLRDAGAGIEALESALSACRDLSDPRVNGVLSALSGSTAEEGTAAALALLDVTGDSSPAGRWAAMLEALRDEWTRRPDLAAPVAVHAAQRGGQFAVCVRKLRPLRHHDAALIYLDGTADLMLSGAVLGGMLEVRVDVPRRMIATQVTGLTFSDSSLAGTASAHDAQAAANRRRDLIEAVRKIAAQEGPARVLVTATRKTLAALGDDLKALGVHTAHFGALRGVNRFSDCTAVVCIGRLQPPPSALEDAARPFIAAAGRDLVTVAGRLPTRTVTVTAKDGTAAQIDAAYHPDPMAEALRRQMAEGEIMQAIDRLRMIWCDAPKRVFLLNSLPTVQPDHLTPWDSFRTGGSVFDRMARAGLVPDTAAEAFRLFPDLWGSIDTAKRDYAEAGAALIGASLNMNLIEVCTDKETAPAWRRVQWKAAPTEGRARIRAVTGWVLSAPGADAVRAALESRTGPLASCVVLDSPEPAKALPAPAYEAEALPVFLPALTRAADLAEDAADFALTVRPLVAQIAEAAPDADAEAVADLARAALPIIRYQARAAGIARRWKGWPSAHIAARSSRPIFTVSHVLRSHQIDTAALLAVRNSAYRPVRLGIP